MSVHSFALQTSLYARLTGDSTLVGLLASPGIYDDVPETTTYPYVVIGDDDVTEFGSKTLDGHEHDLEIHVWAQSRGRKIVKQIMERLYELLHNHSLSVSGADLVNLRGISQLTLVESDGITRHGISRFRAVVFDQAL